MARVRLVEQQHADADVQAFYAEIGNWLKPFPGRRAQATKVPQIWRALAHNVELARYINNGSQYFLSRWAWGLCNMRLRQIVIFTITRRLGCTYAYTGNWPIAEKVGLSRAQYEAFANLDSIDESTLFDAEERLLIRYVDELGRRADAGDELFEAIVARYGDQVAVEITAFVGFRMLTSVLINTLQIADD